MSLWALAVWHRADNIADDKVARIAIAADDRMKYCEYCQVIFDEYGTDYDMGMRL